LGASTESRCWPVSHFARLADELVAKHANVRIVLIGGPFDEGKAQQFLSQVSSQTRECVDNRIGKTGLQALLTLIDSFHVLVTGDTGPLHLAVALKVKTISLFVTADSRLPDRFRIRSWIGIIQVPVPAILCRWRLKARWA
jgi:ADP-heptose:LPS heptosyltransferase